MENIKRPLIAAAALFLALSAPVMAQTSGLGPLWSPPLTGCGSAGFVGPCPCTQLSCPFSPPADTTLDKLDGSCNPPRIPCANYDPNKNPPENKDGWTKTPNGYISNACTVMECVPQNCAASPNIPPCAAEKKAKDDAAKAETAKAENLKKQQAEDLARKNFVLNGDKNNPIPGTTGSPGITGAPATNSPTPGANPTGPGSPASDPSQGSPALPPSDYLGDTRKQAGLIDAAGLDEIGNQPEPAGDYHAVGNASQILEGGGKTPGGASVQGSAAKNQAKDLTSEASHAGKGEGALGWLRWKASLMWDGPQKTTQDPNQH